MWVYVSEEIGALGVQIVCEDDGFGISLAGDGNRGAKRLRQVKYKRSDPMGAGRAVHEVPAREKRRGFGMERLAGGAAHGESRGLAFL